MQAGFARVEITPPADEHPEMMGFGAFLGRTALEIAQPLHVRASYLEGEEAALLLSFDSCGLREDLADEVRAAAGKAVGLAPAQVITACTHTHSAPSVMPIIGWGEFHEPTAERLPRQAAQAARAARKHAAPVTVSAGVTELEDFNRNRVYGPGGPRDTRVRVLAFRDEAGALRGAWAHYTCHPVWLCEKCRVISPDFCGVAMQALEAEQPGFVGTFLQGPCGDINPVRAHFPQERSLVHLAHAGYRFRRAVGEALAQTKPLRGERVRAVSSRLPLPVAVMSEATLNAFVASAQDRGEGWRRLVKTARPQMEEEAKRLAKHASREVPISALRVANHTLTFHPFEMFTALGLQIEANIGGSAWTVGYANSYEGYAPTVDRFAPQSGDYAAHAVPLMMGRHPYRVDLGEELVAGLSALGKTVGGSMSTPSFTPFDECAAYEQEDAPGLSFRKVLPEGVIANVDMGLVTAEGPTHKFAGRHEWDQVYLVFGGTGYVHLAGEKVRIDRPGIVVIPAGTEHSIEVEAGVTMQYVYVNRR